MNIRRRIEKLEIARPEPVADEFLPGFEFRVAGMSRVDVIREYIRRYRTAIADPRATEAQRDEWKIQLDRLEPTLASELEVIRPRPRHDERSRADC